MPDRPFRKAVRLQGFEYASPGAYFITVCTHRREPALGEVIGEAVRLSAIGVLVRAAWLEIPRPFPGIDLDALVVMPNHVHGILVLTQSVGSKHASPLPRPSKERGTSHGSLPAVIQAFKAASARGINLLHGTIGAPVWQRDYYEHVIRSAAELDRLRGYIEQNPLRWALDCENPRNT